jgi:hypothetical protein
MFEPVIAPIAFAVIMLGLTVYAVTRAVRRRMRNRDTSSTDAERQRARERRAG